ncbi:NAD(P)H-dependent oxidoreductase [Microbacterium lushaniae]|uniref:NAD(P)H-dependent oxidoreductase n=1 Tax=Microbacterium lushaniae TaxID=2614639 RepID=A0A5J6L8A6_9MICO|nr:NAD(P)H-dependent oxidoreductase [Microbacterium lushaniae]
MAVIVGSIRRGRKGDSVGRWAVDHAQSRRDADYVLVDLASIGLPRFDAETPPSFGRYRDEHTQRWSHLIAGFDAFVFVTPEYNRSIPAALKDAIDHLYSEWNDKAAGFIGYGVVGGVRAVEHLRLICGELHLADVSTSLAIDLTDITREGVHATGRYEAELDVMLDELGAWARALQPLRRHRASTSAA